MWGFFLILGLAVLLFVALIFIGIRYKFNYWRVLAIPHETPKSVSQIVHDVWHSTPSGDIELVLDLDRINELYGRFRGSGPFCGHYHFLNPVALVLDLEFCKQILIKDFANFNDRGHFYNKSADSLSAHLYNLCGQSWRQTRPRLEAILNINAQEYLVDGLRQQCQNLVQQIEKIFGENKSVKLLLKIEPILSRFVCDALAICVFGLSPANSKYTLKEFYNKTQEALTAPFRHGRFIQNLLHRYPALGKKLGMALTAQPVHTYFTGLVQDVVSQREADKSEICDYMQLLIDKTREQFSSAQTDNAADLEIPVKQRFLNELSSHAYGFIKMGYPYTSKSLCYALQELAIHQDVQERVRQEIILATQKYDGNLILSCINELELMWQVMQETIRIHPVMPLITRRTLSDYRAPNNPKYFLKRGMTVVIPVHAFNNDAAYYQEPHIFRPERFSQQQIQLRNPYAWLGFGAGPRDCVGIPFVQLFTRLTLAHLLLKFRFSINSESESGPPAENGFTLRVEKI